MANIDDVVVDDDELSGEFGANVLVDEGVNSDWMEGVGVVTSDLR